MRPKLAFHAREVQRARAERLARDACKRLGVAFGRVEAVSTGRNFGAFVVKSEPGDFILKSYRQWAPDATARFLRELNFLTWANRESFDEVPVLMAKSRRSRWIAMEKLSGTAPENVGDQHVLLAARFVGRLADVSPSSFRRCIRARHDLRKGSPIGDQLRRRLRETAKLFSRDFPIENLLPSAPSLFCNYPESYLESDVQIFQSYLLQNRKRWKSGAIVSPSDFGFHNTVETTVEKTLVLRFFDFEYAGLDHPLKLLMDFALQPDYLLSDNQIDLFLDVLDSRFAISREAIPRAVWRLFVFKWILIIAKATSQEAGVLGLSYANGPGKVQKYWNRFGCYFE
jgi:hypothetical protein